MTDREAGEITHAAANVDDADTIRRRPRLLYVCDRSGRLVAINEPWGAKCAAPWAYLCHGQGVLVFAVRHDVPDEAARRVSSVLAGLRSVEESRLDAVLCDALRALSPQKRIVHHGPVYRFPADLPAASGVTVVDRRNAHVLHGGFDDDVEQLEVVQPCVAVVESGRAVSVCRVVRRSFHDLEAGVETLPSGRRRGYGAEVVAAWAALVRRQAMNPLYSTSWDNVASIGLAARLGLMRIGVDLSVV